MLDVGLIKKLISISSPFEIPPKIPPELFELKPVLVISSLNSDPLDIGISSELPIETDLTALMLIIALAKSAFSLSKTGSPRPTGQFCTFTPNLAPIESPSLISSSKKDSRESILVLSGKKNLFLLT